MPWGWAPAALGVSREVVWMVRGMDESPGSPG